MSNYQFGKFTLDTSRKMLFHGTRRVQIGRLAFEVLTILIENRQRLVRIDELIRAIGIEQGGEHRVVKIVHELRRILGDDPRQSSYINTVRGYGYRFVDATVMWGSDADSFQTLAPKSQRRHMSVFLCHASDDKPAVRELRRRLLDDHFHPWLDEEELLPGQDFALEIRKAISTCDAIIICLSRGAVTKEGFVQKEIKYALDAADEKPEGTIFLIPLLLEDCIVPERLRHLHWVNLCTESGYDRLIRALSFRAQTIAFSH